MGVEDEVGRLATVMAEVECCNCGKKGHKESEGWKKRADSEITGSGSGRTEQGNR